MSGRDKKKEPHWIGVGWLGEGQAAEWEPLTEDTEIRKFVPKRNLPCHGEERQRLGFVTRDGEVVALEAGCAKCRAAMKQGAEEFAFKSDSIDRAATEWLRKRKVKIDRRGFMKVRE